MKILASSIKGKNQVAFSFRFFLSSFLKRWSFCSVSSNFSKALQGPPGETCYVFEEQNRKQQGTHKKIDAIL